MARGTLLLVDAYSQIYRAFYAIPDLSNSKGMPTNAVYGFTTMLRKLLSEEAPMYCAAVFDPPGPTVRHEHYADYKASRPPMPEDLAVQLPYVRQVCEALRIAVLEIPEYEADDVIGAMATRADAAGVPTVIVSEDKDLLQLVSAGVHLLTERVQRRVYDPAGVEDRFGVPPRLIPDLLGLMGDKVDDIPGVPGIGPKRAVDLLTRYGSLETALEHADEFAKYKWGRNLKEFAEQARLSKRLATVHTGLEVEFDPDLLRVREPDAEACHRVFTELEFRGAAEEFVAPAAANTGDYRALRNAADVAEVVASIGAAGRVSLYLLQTAEKLARPTIVGIGLSWQPGSGCYLPTGHERIGADNIMSVDEALATLRSLFAGKAVTIVGHDLKRDLLTFARHGLIDLPVAFDTMVASYVLDPTRPSHRLADLTLNFIGVAMAAADDQSHGEQHEDTAISVEQAAHHAAERADLALQLTAILSPELEAQGLADLFEDLELPLINVLASMEERGVRIDTEYLREMSHEIGSDMERLRALIHDEAGVEFNLNSPRQLAQVLFDRLQLPVGGRTAKTKSRSTRAEVLSGLAKNHPIAAHILEYRELSKLKSTYIDALPALVNSTTGRVHTSLNQTVAATGRLSSSNPNLQNMPIRTPLGRRIRQAFIPAEGNLLVTADYSQVELRIMAHLSGDNALRAAFAEDLDIHRATAAEIFGLRAEEVTPHHRDRAKVINFGILYGMGPQRLAREFGITIKEARGFIDRYFAVYSGVKQFLEQTIEKAVERGYVTTLMGRIRHVPELQSQRPMVRAAGERLAVNTPIQGTAADLIKLAMVNLDRRLRTDHAGSYMIIQVHDELVLEAREEDVELIADLVRHEMENALALDVPLRVDVGWGSNWMEAKP